MSNSYYEQFNRIMEELSRVVAIAAKTHPNKYSNFCGDWHIDEGRYDEAGVYICVEYNISWDRNYPEWEADEELIPWEWLDMDEDELRSAFAEKQKKEDLSVANKEIRAARLEVNKIEAKLRIDKDALEMFQEQLRGAKDANVDPSRLIGLERTIKDYMSRVSNHTRERDCASGRLECAIAKLEEIQ